MINPSLDYKIQENDKTADVNKIDPTCTQYTPKAEGLQKKSI